MTGNALIPANSDMAMFDPAAIKRAGELLRCPLDEASILKALIIQKDTGLSIARGEISVVAFKDVPVVFVNKNGYIAYANSQKEYDGYDSGIEGDDPETAWAWCKVYRKDRTRPISVKIKIEEFNKHQAMWKTSPYYMGEKQAISIAHRTAFPALNGTYTEDEIPYRVDPRPDDIVISPIDAVPYGDSDSIVFASTTDTPCAVKKSYAQISDIPPVNTCTLQTAETIRQNMQDKGMSLEVFDRARISSSEFDRDMINTDFQRQLDEIKAKQLAQPATKPAAKPATPAPAKEPVITCDICSAPLSKEEQEATLKSGLGMYCAACLKVETAVKQLHEEQDTKAAPKQIKQTKPDTPVQMCPNCKSNPSMSPTECQGYSDRVAGRFAYDPTLCSVCAEVKLNEYEARQPPAGAIVCEMCGAAITKGQQDMSKLFAGKTLCKNCMSVRGA